MTAEQPDREREIFISALERETPGERNAYLDGACGADEEMRARIAALLRANDLAGGFLPMDDLNEPPSGSTQKLGYDIGLPAEPQKPGDQVGPYKLREKVGEGGCGVVYVAEQEKPIRRRVALKVIKLGMDTKSVIARFEAERQALAMMEHPNIAKVLDAGATAAGRPYFVMELVRGTKITDYCDQHKLPTRARLGLFIQVCQAIQHAHQKGIIHRDIKPSNILVTMHDGVPVPKIIDFGIAKATEGRLTDLTVYTDLHQFIGTPAYMSPEQAEMSGLDIDTRADIYSLGVLLYELLTGRTPFDAKTLLQSGLEAMRRTIRETEPLPPSTRLSTMLNAELAAVAQHHNAEPPRLVNLVRGDLDWIVMKALEKDRARRYETANGLAMDIQRYLTNEPIVARPQSPGYRFQRLVRRNRLVFIAASGICAALVLGLAGTFWQWRQAERNHQEAEANLYAADMNRASQVLDDLGPVAARALLEHHAGQRNLHGFEWRYLWKRCWGDFAYSWSIPGGRVWKVAFSPDDSTLAVLDSGGEVRLLDVQTRSERVCLTNVIGLAGFTSSGQELLLAVRAQTNRSLVRYAPKTGRLAELSPAPSLLGWLPNLLADCLTAVIPGPDGELSLVDARSGMTTSHLKLPDKCFTRWEAFGEACAVSADGQWIFSLDNGAETGTVGTLSIREMASGRILATYPDEAVGTPKMAIVDRNYVLRFLPGGKTVVWANRDGFIHTWRWADPSATPRAEPGHRGIVWDIEGSADGRRFATAGNDQTVRVWDAQSLKELCLLRGHHHEVFTVAFSHDGQWLASGGADGTIKLWNLDNPGCSGDVPGIVARQLANRIVFSPDGHNIAVGMDDDSIGVIDTQTCRLTANFKDLLFPARFMADGSRLFGLAGVGNLASRKVERVIPFPDMNYPWAQDVSPDGRWLVRSFRSTARRGDFIELLDLQRGSVFTNFTPTDIVMASRFTEDGQTVLASLDNGRLVWWTVTDHGLEPRRTIQLGHASRAIALEPDGALVALGGLSRISLVDYRTGAIRQRLFGHGQQVAGLAFSPDGGTLASCSLDGTIKIWNLHTMQEVCTLPFDTRSSPGKEIGVQGVGFSPDGNSLWAFSRSGTLRYWRTATQAEIAAAEAADKP
ncbi:MAG TPA: protein kinase [Verrucomicrobiae bacterium]|nr:protein kinase [Verrucomicrobiae bacterium]